MGGDAFGKVGADGGDAFSMVLGVPAWDAIISSDFRSFSTRPECLFAPSFPS